MYKNRLIPKLLLRSSKYQKDKMVLVTTSKFQETVEIGGVEVAKGFQGIDVSQFNNPVLSQVMKDYKRDMYLSFLYSNATSSSALKTG